MPEYRVKVNYEATVTVTANTEREAMRQAKQTLMDATQELWPEGTCGVDEASATVIDETICPRCGGDGESMECDGPHTVWLRCVLCDGSGTRRKRV